MAGTSVASPLCTWLVAACMSVACDKERSLGPASGGFPATTKRLSRWARRRRVALSSGMGGGCRSGARESSASLISAFCGSRGIQGLMSSCLAFEPCEEYCSSWWGRSALFGDGSFSLFGSSDEQRPGPRRKRHLTAAVPPSSVSGILLLSGSSCDSVSHMPKAPPPVDLQSTSTSPIPVMSG